MASFSRAEGILAVLFGLGFVLGFLLTPLGVETRIHELRTWVFAAFFITIGLLLPLAGLVSLFLRKAKLAGVYKGRKPSVDVAQVRALKAQGIGPSGIAKRLGLVPRA